MLENCPVDESTSDKADLGPSLAMARQSHLLGPRAVLRTETTTYQDKWRQLAKLNVWKPVVR